VLMVRVNNDTDTSSYNSKWISLMEFSSSGLAQEETLLKSC